MTTEWGNWNYDASSFELGYRRDGAWVYAVDLDRCRSSAEVLDWIYQVRHKGVFTAEDVADLLDAIDAVFAVQSNLCPSGTSLEIEPRATAAARGFGA